MSQKLIAVLGMTVMVQAPFSGTVAVVTAPSTKVFADSKAVYSGTIAVLLTAVSGSGITSGTGGGAIVPTATKVLADNQPVLRQDDQNLAITVTDSVAPYGTATVGVKITVAGQTKVLAE